MIDRDLEVNIRFIRGNGSADECFAMSHELSRRAENILRCMWPYIRLSSNWECRAARRYRVHGFALESKVHGNYLARHKWPRYKRQYANYKCLLELDAAASEMMQLGLSREEGER